MRDRANVVAPDLGLRRALAVALVEGDHEPVPSGLRGHHRGLRACDELPGVRRVLGPDRDPGRDGELAHRVRFELRELLADALCERDRARQVARGQDHRELLAADAADDVRGPDRCAKDVGDLVQQLIADAVAVDVVHLLEVVEVEHHERDRLVRRRRAQELLPQPVVEGAVVVETGQRVGLGLVLEPRADVGVVDGECRGVAEALREQELLVGERGVLADAIDVERALQLPARDQWHGDEGLRLDRRAGDEAHARIEVRPVRRARPRGGPPPSP